MPSDFNPYAPPTPTPEVVAAPRRGQRGGGGAWQEGGLLVIEKASCVLPDRCVICNRDTDYKIKSVFSWHPPAYYLLAPLGGILFSAIISAVRKHATVEVGLCNEHRVQRRTGLLLAGIGAAVSILFFVAGTSSHTPALMLVSLVSILLCPIIGLRMARVAGVSRIDDTHAWLKVGAPFLASLPASPDEAWPSDVAPKKKKKKKVKKAAKATAAAVESNDSAERDEPAAAAESNESADRAEPARRNEPAEAD